MLKDTTVVRFRQPDAIEDPLHLVDSPEVGAADEESRRAVAGSLPARGVDRRLPGGARRPLGQGRAELVASRDLAADRGMAGGLRCLADPRPLGPAIRSEEHTSELQSRLHLVCRLLL